MTEIVIYHSYNAKRDFTNKPLPEASRKVSSRVADFLLKVSKIFAALGLIILIYFYAPSVWAWAQGSTSQATVANFKLTSGEVTNLASANINSNRNYQPPFDPRLPAVNHLSIPSIGVDTPLQEATYDNYEEALKKGVWRVSDFGAPGDNGRPIILAAHRFGYLDWTNLYRRQNSFYNLPKLNIGDTVEIVWHQRKYTYEVYSAVTSDQITDYSADLILYTCESLTGKQRVFRYAKLLQI